MTRISEANVSKLLEQNKYRNRKTTVDGITFDSQKEATRWCELTWLQKAGEIRDLQRQVLFTLIPAQKDENGKVIERACTYVADFSYRDAKTNRLIVEDVKSPATKTPVYKIKRKLMLYRNGIQIREV